jgi:hypothetical protein
MGNPILASAQFKMKWPVKEIVSIQMGWPVILEKVNIPFNSVPFEMERPMR